MDVGLIAAAKKAVGEKPRRHVTPAHLLAVVQQESGGVPYFIDTKPGGLYAANVQMAVEYFKWRKDTKTGQRVRVGPFRTGFNRQEIHELITIPGRVGDWIAPKDLQGKPAKFRFEYSYWESRKFQHLSPEDRFYMASSWGLVQFMGPNITGQATTPEAIQFIRRFTADIPMQLLYGAGMLDDLLAQAGGDLHKAYRGYNSGDIDSQQPAVIARADNVVKNYQRIKQQIGG